MNWNRVFRLRSFVQYFCVSGFVVFVGFFQPAAAALSEKECRSMKEADKSDESRKECAKFSAGADACDTARRSVDSARDSYSTKCGDAGMAGTTCKNMMEKCTSVGESEEFKDDPSMWAAFSEALGVPSEKVGGSCPKYSGQGFFERKDKYERDLKDINKELKDNKKEIADLNKDFNSDVKKIQEDIAEAQEDYQKAQAKTGEDQRNRATENAKTASAIAQSIRKLQSEIMTRRQNINTIYMDKNNSLAQITESAAKRTCMGQVREERKKYDAIVAGSMKSQFQSASLKKKQLNDLFQECMVKFDQGRMKLIQESNDKIETTERAINSAQSDLDDATTQLSQMKATEEETKAAEATALTNAQNALQQKIQRATAELQSLQTTTQAKNAALVEEQKYLADRSKSASNSISSLGAKPEDETSTVKITQVTAAYDGYRAAHWAAKDEKACGSSYKDRFWDAGTSEDSKVSAKKPGAK
jgi:myosin heavy subunit